MSQRRGILIGGQGAGCVHEIGRLQEVCVGDGEFTLDVRLGRRAGSGT